MPRYMISLDVGSMDHISDQDLPSVSDAAHRVVGEAKAAGVWIFGGGIHRNVATCLSDAFNALDDTSRPIGRLSSSRRSRTPAGVRL